MGIHEEKEVSHFKAYCKKDVMKYLQGSTAYEAEATLLHLGAVVLLSSAVRGVQASRNPAAGRCSL